MHRLLRAACGFQHNIISGGRQLSSSAHRLSQSDLIASGDDHAAADQLLGGAKGTPVRTNVEDMLFKLFSNDEQKLPVGKFLQGILETGLRKSDPRLKEFMQNLRTAQSLSHDGSAFSIDHETFHECIKVRLRKNIVANKNCLRVKRTDFRIQVSSQYDCQSLIVVSMNYINYINYLFPQDNIVLITRAFLGEFVIPEFRDFTSIIDEIYWKARTNTAGKVADYIPQLARYSPDYWGVSICTVDGQRHSIGDTDIPFCLQSTSKPLNYVIALEDLGSETVHQYVGQEPSGRIFNELILDQNRMPHNPLINAGAILTVSMIQRELKLADRFDYIMRIIRAMAGGEYVGFSNPTFLSERETADRNYALGYYMKENHCFPEGILPSANRGCPFKLNDLICP